LALKGWRPRPGNAEAPFQFAATKLGDSGRAALSNPFDPAVIEQMLGQCRSKGTGEMIAAFAPIEALPGKNAAGFSQSGGIYSQLAKPLRSLPGELVIPAHCAQKSASNDSVCYAHP
jgi:hypothetical protein